MCSKIVSFLSLVRVMVGKFSRKEKCVVFLWWKFRNSVVVSVELECEMFGISVLIWVRLMMSVLCRCIWLMLW